MYSPKELEGEVDHSFFDSDSESRGAEDANREGKPEWGRAEDGGKNSVHMMEPSRAFSAAYSACGDVSQPGGKQPEEPPENSTGTPTESGSSAEEDEGEDEDGYEQSEEDDEESEDEQDERLAGRLVAGRAVPRRPSGRLGHRRRLSSSSGSESSYSGSGSYVSEPESPTRRKTSAASGSPQILKPGASQKHKLWLPAGESDDTVTDVTPLSTPDISPIQSFDLTSGGSGKGAAGHTAARQQNVSVDLRVPEDSHPEGQRMSGTVSRAVSADTNSPQPKSPRSPVPGMNSRRGQKAADDTMDLNQLLTAFFKMEQKAEGSLHKALPTGQSRKNYSFSNEEVRRIDQENQRLLQVLSRQAPRPGSASTRAGGSARLYHSALNRQREQQRIERENMAFLKRLESVKPTVGMRRSEQLTSYQHRTRSLGSTATVPMPNRSPSSRSSAGACSCSGLSKAQPELSVSLTAPKPSRGPEPRAAWS